MREIARFMTQFGLLSSMFDLLTFGVLLFVFAAPAAVFRTAWFVESLLTELVVALVVRTRRPLYRSRPGAFLLRSTAVLVPLTLALPFVPGAEIVDLVPLSPALVGAVLAITAAYALAAELLKRRFFARSAA